MGCCGAVDWTLIFSFVYLLFILGWIHQVITENREERAYRTGLHIKLIFLDHFHVNH